MGSIPGGRNVAPLFSAKNREKLDVAFAYSMTNSYSGPGEDVKISSGLLQGLILLSKFAVRASSTRFVKKKMLKIINF